MKTLLLLCCLYFHSEATTINRDDCVDRQSATAGEALDCPDGYWVVGSCGSGENADCPSGMRNKIRCCAEVAASEDEQQKLKACEFFTSDAGGNLQCQENGVVKTICGSGKNRDCGFGSTDYHNVIQCCDEHQLALSGQCFWQYAKHGEQLMCQEPSVAGGFCGSGENLDCNGGSDSHGLLCCVHD